MLEPAFPYGAFDLVTPYKPTNKETLGVVEVAAVWKGPPCLEGDMPLTREESVRCMGRGHM